MTLYNNEFNKLVKSSAIITIVTTATRIIIASSRASTGIHREDNSQDDDEGDDFNDVPNRDCYVATKGHVATLFSTSIIARSIVILCL
jgi:hypothetical protein